MSTPKSNDAQEKQRTVKRCPECGTVLVRTAGGKKVCPCCHDVCNSLADYRRDLPV